MSVLQPISPLPPVQPSAPRPEPLPIPLPIPAAEESTARPAMTLVLLSVTGPDRPGITSRIARILADHQARLQDVEQVTNGGNLALSFLLELTPPTGRDHPVFKDLIFCAWELGLQADFRFISEDDVRVHEPRYTYALTVFGREIVPGAIAALADALARRGTNIDKIHKLSAHSFSCLEMLLSAPLAEDLQQLKQVLLPLGKQYEVDLAIQRENVYRRAKRLVVLDMDSTLTQGEVIDELAARHGVGQEVARITERAMHGELDFEQALRARVKLLEGLSVTTLSDVRTRIQLTPGGHDLLHALKKLGYRIAVISGGFTYFTDWLKQQLGLDYAYANELEMRDGKLTGRLRGLIVDARRKADLLETIAQGEGISLDQVIAVGDGANDLQMLKRAGLGIAFNPKRSLRESAEHTLDQPQLDSILYLLGIREHELEQLRMDS